MLKNIVCFGDFLFVYAKQSECTAFCDSYRQKKNLSLSTCFGDIGIFFFNFFAAKYLVTKNGVDCLIVIEIE